VLLAPGIGRGKAAWRPQHFLSQGFLSTGASNLPRSSEIGRFEGRRSQAPIGCSIYARRSGAHP